MTSSDHTHIVQSCLQDAAERLSWPCTIREHRSLEGRFLVVVPTATSAPLALVASVAPTQSPYDDILRDRARSVAARLQIPWIVVTSMRTTLVYSTDAITRRLPPFQMVRMQWKGAHVHQAHQTLAAAPRVAFTESLRSCLAWMRDHDATADHRSDVEALVGRCTAMMDELEACLARSGSTNDRTSTIEQWVAATVGYSLAAAHHPEMLPPFHVPHTIRDQRLILDILQAYLNLGRRSGFDLPEVTDVVDLSEELQTLWTVTITDLLSTIESIPFHEWEREAIQAVLDALSRWGGAHRGSVVPTTDILDLVLATIPLPQSGRVVVREYGTAVGALSRRVAQAHGNVISLIDPVAMAADPFLRIQSVHTGSIADTEPPADLVYLSVDRMASAERMVQALHHAAAKEVLATHGACIVMLPTLALTTSTYQSVREALLRIGDVSWVFTSDGEPLTEPNGGYSFVVVSRVPEGDRRPTVLVTFRTSLPVLLGSVGDVAVLLRYLTTGLQGKMNAEVLVRYCTHQEFVDGAIILPADILLSVVAKLQAVLVPLHTMGTVSSGLRTGASDVLVPDVPTIAEQGLEEAYWQRQLPSGEMIDTIMVTSADDLESAFGVPRSDRRLLLLPADRSQFDHLRVGDHIQRAEREGVHTRPSVRHRTPWWHLEPPTIPSIIVAKEQGTRWLWATNRSRVHISDAYVGVTLDRPDLADRLVLWMNSTLGMFIHELLNIHHHVADVTVRDVHEFLVPTPDTLACVDVRRFKDVAYRPAQTVEQELGTSVAEIARPELVQRDRRRLDRYWMEEVLHLTLEEQTVVYRFVLTWRKQPSNLHHLAQAVLVLLKLRRSTEPLWEWYPKRLAELAGNDCREIDLPARLTRAEAADSMFTPQVIGYVGDQLDTVHDCTSSEEAHLIALLHTQGLRAITIPNNAQITARLFREADEHAVQYLRQLHDALQRLPGEIRPYVHQLVGASQ